MAHIAKITDLERFLMHQEREFDSWRSTPSRLSTCYHEAGHALISFISGKSVGVVVRQDGAGITTGFKVATGEAFRPELTEKDYVELIHDKDPDVQTTWEMVVALSAGVVAEYLLERGSMQDRYALSIPGSDGSRLGTLIDRWLWVKDSGAAFVAQQRASVYLTTYWPMLSSLAVRLEQYGVVEAAEVASIYSRIRVPAQGACGAPTCPLLNMEY